MRKVANPSDMLDGRVTDLPTIDNASISIDMLNDWMQKLGPQTQLKRDHHKMSETMHIFNDPLKFDDSQFTPLTTIAATSDEITNKYVLVKLFNTFCKHGMVAALEASLENGEHIKITRAERAWIQGRGDEYERVIELLLPNAEPAPAVLQHVTTEYQQLVVQIHVAVEWEGAMQALEPALNAYAMYETFLLAWKRMYLMELMQDMLQNNIETLLNNLK